VMCVLYREFEELWSFRGERALVNCRELSILQRTALSGTVVRYVGRQMASDKHFLCGCWYWSKIVLPWRMPVAILL
jgi:hypothetical protein